MLDTYLEQLAPYRDIDIEAYRQDWKVQRIIERTLHLAIETCMDVADHLVADRRLRVPETGAESFEILAEAGLLSHELGALLASMVGFRNILVHDYLGVDLLRVWGVVEHRLPVLKRTVAGILAEQQNGP